MSCAPLTPPTPPSPVGAQLRCWLGWLGASGQIYSYVAVLLPLALLGYGTLLALILRGKLGGGGGGGAVDIDGLFGAARDVPSHTSAPISSRHGDGEFGSGVYDGGDSV